MNTVLPLLSAIVSLAFAVTVFDQYLARRRSYQLVWTIGLLWFFLGATAEFVVGAFGINETAYRLWYMSGAIFSAAYLGMGTAYLLMPRRVSHIIMIGLLLASVFAVFKVFTTAVDLSLLPAGPMSGEAFPSGWAGPRLLAPFFNTFGSLALIGGALYSAWEFWRRRILPHRVTSNVLIAIGAFFPVFGGSLARAGNASYLYASELLGVVIIFLGFLRSKEVFGLYRIPLVHGLRKTAETLNPKR